MGVAAEPDAGPDSPHVPKLPAGWIAQWDSSSRKYYYVQISTGKSTWELPTTVAPGVVTGSASSTPVQPSPYAPPPPMNEMSGDAETAGTRGLGDEHSEQTDRGLGTMALNLLSQGSGGKPSGSNSLMGQLASSVLSGGKPQGSNNMGGQQQQGGFGGFIGGFLPHSQPPQQTNFGYSTTGHSGTYDGQEPPATYQPPNANPAAQYGSASQGPSPGQGGQAQNQQAPYGQQGQGFPSYPSQTQAAAAFSQPPSAYPSTYGQQPPQGYPGSAAPTGPTNPYGAVSQPFAQQPGPYAPNQSPSAIYGASQSPYAAAQQMQPPYGGSQPPMGQFGSGPQSQPTYGQTPPAGYPGPGQYHSPPTHQAAPGGYGQGSNGAWPDAPAQNQQQGQGGYPEQGYYQRPGW